MAMLLRIFFCALMARSFELKASMVALVVKNKSGS